MKAKKVLYIAHESGLGGANRSLIDYFTVADKRICPIVVLPSAGLIEVKLNKLGIKYYVIPFKNGYGRIGDHSEQDIVRNFIDNYEAARHLATIITTEKIEIVHSNSSVINVGSMASIMTNVPHVWHVREFMEEDFGWEYWDKELKKRLFTCAGEVISITDAVYNALENKYGVKSCRIYDGIAVDCLDNGLDKENNNEFLFAGSISENKGQFDAVLAVNVLVKRGIDVKLYIIGGGNAQTKWAIKRFIRDNDLGKNIELISYCDDLSVWRRRCSFSITGSKMEALGRVTVEAMASGIIPIGTDSGGTAELIGKDSERGFLYEYGNYEQLAEKMLSIMHMSENEKKAMISRMKKFVKDTFSPDEYADKLNELYDKIVLSDTKNVYQEGLRSFLEEEYSLLKKQDFIDVYPKRDYSFLRKKVKQNLANIVKYCNNNAIEKVIIYGMGDVGCALYDCIEDSNIRIVGVMDRSTKYLGPVTNVINVGDDIKDAECIFVATIKDEQKIVEQLKQCYSISIIGVLSLIEGN